MPVDQCKQFYTTAIEKQGKNEWFNVSFCIVCVLLCTLCAHTYTFIMCRLNRQRRFLNEDRQLLLQILYITINQTTADILSIIHFIRYKDFILSLEAISKQNKWTKTILILLVIVVLLYVVILNCVHQKHIIWTM